MGIDIENNLISTGDTGWPYRTAFGSDNIRKPEIRKWYLSIPKDSEDTIDVAVWSVIGIIECYKVNLNIDGNFYNKENNGYGLKGWNGGLFHGSNKEIKQRYVQKLFKGDKIIIVLNMEQGSL